MKKVLMSAHVIDDSGATVPGQIVERHDAAAEKYVRNGWAIFIEEEKKVEEKIEVKVEEVTEEEVTEEAVEIESPEDGLPEAETATLKRRGRPRKVV